MVRGYLLAPAGEVNAAATEKRFVGMLRAICRENVLEVEEGLPCPMPVDQSSEVIVPRRGQTWQLTSSTARLAAQT